MGITENIKDITTYSYDPATKDEHLDIWTLSSYALLTRTDEYSQITITSGTYATANTAFEDEVSIEFDFNISGVNNRWFQVLVNSSNTEEGFALLTFQCSLDTWYHMNIIINEDEVISNCNDRTVTVTLFNPNKFNFSLNNGITGIKFKNFIIHKR